MKYLDTDGIKKTLAEHLIKHYFDEEAAIAVDIMNPV